MIRYGWILMQNTICQGDIVSDWASDGGPDGGIEYPDLGTLKDKAKELLDLRISHLQSRMEEVDSCEEPDCQMDSYPTDAVEEIASHAYDDAGDFCLEFVAIEGEGPEAVMSFFNEAYDPTPLSELYKEAGRNGTVVWPPPDEEREAA